MEGAGMFVEMTPACWWRTCWKHQFGRSDVVSAARACRRWAAFGMASIVRMTSFGNGRGEAHRVIFSSSWRSTTMCSTGFVTLCAPGSLEQEHTLSRGRRGFGACSPFSMPFALSHLSPRLSSSAMARCRVTCVGIVAHAAGRGSGQAVVQERALLRTIWLFPLRDLMAWLLGASYGKQPDPLAREQYTLEKGGICARDASPAIRKQTAGPRIALTTKIFSHRPICIEGLVRQFWWGSAAFPATPVTDPIACATRFPSDDEVRGRSSESVRIGRECGKRLIPSRNWRTDAHTDRPIEEDFSRERPIRGRGVLLPESRRACTLRI